MPAGSQRSQGGPFQHPRGRLRSTRSRPRPSVSATVNGHGKYGRDKGVDLMGLALDRRGESVARPYGQINVTYLKTRILLPDRRRRTKRTRTSALHLSQLCNTIEDACAPHSQRPRSRPQPTASVSASVNGHGHSQRPRSTVTATDSLSVNGHGHEKACRYGGLQKLQAFLV